MSYKQIKAQEQTPSSPAAALSEHTTRAECLCPMHLWITHNPTAPLTRSPQEMLVEHTNTHCSPGFDPTNHPVTAHFCFPQITSCSQSFVTTLYLPQAVLTILNFGQVNHSSQDDSITGSELHSAKVAESLEFNDPPEPLTWQTLKC